MRKHAYLLLGSNLGDREALLRAAVDAVGAECGPIVAASAIYETAAWGVTDQPPFLNQVLCIETALPATALLEAALGIEQRAGRERHERWGSRTLDIDVLLYGDEVIDLPQLQVPHPALPQRRFALVPLAEIAPDRLHPVLQQPIAQLLGTCADLLPVHRYLP